VKHGHVHGEEQWYQYPLKLFEMAKQKCIEYKKLFPTV
jgi:hypothetical protein